MRTLLGLLIAVLGAGLLGFLIGAAIFEIFLHGAPGATGLEVLIVLYQCVIGAITGGCAGVVAASLPRTSVRGADYFIVVVLAAIALQTLLSFGGQMVAAAKGLGEVMWHLVGYSGPIIWTVRPNSWHGMVLNSNWLYTLPATLLICSPYFRNKFFE